MNRPLTFAQACAQYPHRFTMEHVPAWARAGRLPGGRYYAPQHRTDAEWYANTRFPGEAGIPRRARYCESTPTWPLGQMLDAPFTTTTTTTGA